MELLKVKTVKEMAQIINEHFNELRPRTETVSIYEALDRVLAADVISSVDVPHFDRSVVDGYAVKLGDVSGASTGIPGFLTMVGEVEMGRVTTLALKPGETVYVPTGGMVPEGTEAMVMIEYTEQLGETDLAVYTNVGANENMMLTGDDIKVGEGIFQRGHKLRPQDIGVLSALGKTEIEVFEPLKIAIISTGDEIVKPGEIPQKGQIVDINTPALIAMTKRFGAEVACVDYAKDDLDHIKLAAKAALGSSDVVVLSGGSSMGEKDFTVKVIEELGTVLLHGLSVKPGKPTILGKAGKKPVIGLPGQPASAIMVYSIILKNLITLFYGDKALHVQKVTGRLTENIHAAPGRRTFQTVAIAKEKGTLLVTPTHGKSGMITLLVYSDGYIELTENEEGKNAGELVEVTLF